MSGLIHAGGATPRPCDPDHPDRRQTLGQIAVLGASMYLRGLKPATKGTGNAARGNGERPTARKTVPDQHEEPLLIPYPGMVDFDWRNAPNEVIEALHKGLHGEFNVMAPSNGTRCPITDHTQSVRDALLEADCLGYIIGCGDSHANNFLGSGDADCGKCRAASQSLLEISVGIFNERLQSLRQHHRRLHSISPAREGSSVCHDNALTVLQLERRGIGARPEPVTRSESTMENRFGRAGDQGPGGCP